MYTQLPDPQPYRHMTIHFPNKQATAILKRLVKAGLTAGDPAEGIRQHCKLNGHTLWVARRPYRLDHYERLMCVGIGKASERMVLAFQELLGSRLTGGLLVTKDPVSSPLHNFTVYEAAHPTPDSRSRRAADAVLQFLKTLTARDLLIFLISGGTSSLLAKPAHGLTLRDKQHTTRLLLRSGATIQEMNIIRKHLSAIKGGHLAASTPATIITLILSDVIGDDLSTIGSGLTAPDPTTFQQARQILKQYKLWDVMTPRAQCHIEQGIRKTISETLKPNDSRFARVQNVVIGNNRSAIQHIAKIAKQSGFHPSIQTSTLQGEAQEVGRSISSVGQKIRRQRAKNRQPTCAIWGGEPTVTHTGKGKGGRAQECVLSAAIDIAGLPNTIVAGFGTDGSDGSSDVAGAVVDGNTLSRSLKKNVDPFKALAHHDSYQFFQKIGGHIITGPTGTNVNDIYLLLTL